MGSSTTGVRVRMDVWKLAEWDPILLWYARAVREMQRRPITDPTSWRYQAAIHEYFRQADPLAVQGETLPSNQDQGRFWTQCQHGSWYFLPWHRMYLGYFEQIVASVIVSLGGPEGWALPYWNYSDQSNPNARRLPPAFRAATLPDNTPNALRVTARRSGANTGGQLGSAFSVDISGCLSVGAFTGQATGGGAGFGGPPTGFSHSGNTIGDLEGVPHGTMHNAVGGWMGGFNTAGLDPIFWLHHANIDRLWVVWRRRDPLHRDPTQAAWLTGRSFSFHDAGGAIVSLRCGQIVDTKVAPFRYRYEDESDPLAGTLESVAATGGGGAMNERAIPEMVGASEQAVTLSGRPASATVPIAGPVGPARDLLESTGAAPRVYLNFENITGEGESVSYAVFLNLPENASEEQQRDLFVGMLPMFGVPEATREEGPHAGSGLHYSLDATNVIRKLEQRNAWDPATMRVTFLPELNEDEAAGGLESVQTSAVQVGRISVYYA